MSKEPNFYIIILSHNFDFYRAISNRLGIKYENRLAADLSDESLSLSTEDYHKEPFNHWRKYTNKNKKYILALIPFVRNLIEYGINREISDIKDDFLFMTLLLHEKKDSRNISFGEIEPLYKEYIGATDFGSIVNASDLVIDELSLIIKKHVQKCLLPMLLTLWGELDELRLMNTGTYISLSKIKMLRSITMTSF